MSKVKKRKRKYTVPMVEASIDIWHGGVSMELPIKVVSEANQYEHWREKHKRKKHQQFILNSWLNLAGCDLPKQKRAKVKFTKLNWGGRKLDTDNLAGAFKHVQDTMAKLMGIDDGDPRVTWQYAQRKSDKAGVEIEVEVT